MSHAENAQALDRLLLCRADLRRRGIKISDSTIARLEKLGAFPKRIRLSTNSVAWISAEIDAYIADLAASREGDR
jgi:predicted DNA-binding transcriptional regulator AlpA